MGVHTARWKPTRFVTFPAILLLLVLFLPPLFAMGCARGESHAAAASSAQAPPPPTIEYVGEWGRRGEAPGQFQDPVGPAVDTIGRVYFADRGTGSVDKFEARGVPLLAFDNPVVRNAAAIAVDRGGAIYVADIQNGRLQIFWPEGDPLRSIRLAPQRGVAAPYASGLPFAFSVDDQGAIFVPNPSAGEVLSFDRHGRLLRAWKMPLGAAGRQFHPSIVVAATDGTIFAGDARSGEIVRYAPDGRPIATLAEPAKDSAVAPLLSMAASPKYLFVLRETPSPLEVWTLDGRLKLTDNLGGRLGASGHAAGGASRVGAALAVTPEGDLIVFDPAGPRVLRFRIHLDAP